MKVKWEDMRDGAFAVAAKVFFFFFFFFFHFLICGFVGVSALKGKAINL